MCFKVTKLFRHWQTITYTLTTPHNLYYWHWAYLMVTHLCLHLGLWHFNPFLENHHYFKWVTFPQLGPTASASNTSTRWQQGTVNFRGYRLCCNVRRYNCCGIRTCTNNCLRTLVCAACRVAGWEKKVTFMQDDSHCLQDTIRALKSCFGNRRLQQKSRKKQYLILRQSRLPTVTIVH